MVIYVNVAKMRELTARDLIFRCCVFSLSLSLSRARDLDHQGAICELLVALFFAVDSRPSIYDMSSAVTR